MAHCSDHLILLLIVSFEQTSIVICPLERPSNVRLCRASDQIGGSENEPCRGILPEEIHRAETSVFRLARVNDFLCDKALICVCVEI